MYSFMNKLIPPVTYKFVFGIKICRTFWEAILDFWKLLKYVQNSYLKSKWALNFYIKNMVSVPGVLQSARMLHRHYGGITGFPKQFA